ncbi:hypothetical protein ABDK56_05510 [Sphingomonas sp. ASV193]|uniref:hypothetical protein n=1 Tax=Sphingomonas sp. ASV193 TaxID=3144405 RepID=UPI0032E8C7C0
MKAFAKLLIAGAATVAVAAPAAAQYYPGYGYGYNNGGNVVGQIINSVLGYGQYPYGNYGYGQPMYMNSQAAINQCARAAEQRLGGGYGGYGGYGSYGAYGYAGGQARVLGITSVQIRSGNALRIHGVASSGRSYARPFGYGSYGYNSNYGVPDVGFTCKVDGYGRIVDLGFDRNYSGYAGPYGDNGGYGNNYGGYPRY